MYLEDLKCWRLEFSGMWPRVIWYKFNNFSEKSSACILQVEQWTDGAITPTPEDCNVYMTSDLACVLEDIVVQGGSNMTGTDCV